MDIPDTGLRNLKKRRTREEILANAIALFQKQGIRETRTSEIARQSGVSPGTLFNYYPTKDALVEAWLRGELDRTLDEAAQTLGERGLRPMLRDVCRSLATDSLESPSLRAEGWRVLGRGRSARFRLHGDSPLVRVVRAEQNRERVRKDLPAQSLAEMLADGIEGGLIAAAEAGGEAPATNLAQALQDRVDLILDGARKRNERVAAPVARAAKRPAGGR